MDISVALLKVKLRQYLSGKITKNEIGFWASSAYHCLMWGEYIEIDKLVVYHFLRNLSSIHAKPNDITDDYPCTDNEVKEILKVLNGEKNLSYSFNIMISKLAYERNNDVYMSKLKFFCEIKNNIFEYSNGKPLNSAKMRELVDYSRKHIEEIITLTDLLESHLISILSENIDHEYEEFYLKKSCIHVGRKEIDKIDFVPNVLKLLECIMSDMCFRIFVQYRKGHPTISMIL